MKLQQLWAARPKTQTNADTEYGNVKKGKYTMKATLPLRFMQPSGAKRIPQGIILTIAMMCLQYSALAETNAVDLASSSGFAVLAGTGITVATPVNSTVITGDIGTFPTTTITGFENVVLTGVNHAGDGVTQTAKNDLTLAYNDAVGRSPTAYYGAIDLGGSNLISGVYNGSSSFAITGALTLDAGGDPNAVWIFQVGSTLTTANNSQIVLTNGAQAANVFWQVGTAATLGTYSDFSGSILALSTITLTTGAMVDGRVLSRTGSVILDNNIINIVPEPASTLLIGLGVAVIFIVRQRFPHRKIFDSDRA